jgi:hypothetical protein
VLGLSRRMTRSAKNTVENFKDSGSRNFALLESIFSKFPLIRKFYRLQALT